MKRIFVLLAVIVSMAGSPIQNVYANEGNVAMKADEKSVGIQRADVIVNKYRVYNGVPKYRRWNETRNCWVDPDWIDIV